MPRHKVPDEIAPATDTTLALWRAEQEKKDRKDAEERQRQARITELERAFIAVRRGILASGDEQKDALAIASTLGHLGRKMADNPDLLVCPPEQIKAKQDTPEAYALLVLAVATGGNETKAAKMLLASWAANQDRHSQVNDFLQGGLEREVMGKANVQPTKRNRKSV